jgi:hypothetical protein
VRRARILLGLVAALLVLATLAGPSALAQETTPSEEPAVVVQPEAEVSEEDWTFRFLVPTVLAISGLVIAITAIGYGVRVRSRYRVVR